MQRTRRHDGADVRRILAAMVTNDIVCGRISTQWESFGLFHTEFANTVGKWCVDYYRKYNSAPNEQLTSLFQEWAGEYPDNDDQIDLIEKFLEFVSDEHKQSEPKSNDYLLDLAQKHFNKVRLEKTIQDAQLELERNHVEDAQNRFSQLKSITLNSNEYVEPVNDFSVWDKALSSHRRRPLCMYSGEAGRFFSDAFVKGEFYAWMAPDKCYKTGHLLDVAYRIIRRGNRVAFFDVGDGDQDEVMARLAVRSSGIPEFGGEIEIPIDWNGENVISKRQNHKKLDVIDAYRSFKKISKRPDALRISCHPNSSISVNQIDNMLEKWEKDGWSTNCVIIDYADILAPPMGIKDNLEKIDETWKALRRLSQQRNCLVVTATQSSSAAYGKSKGLLGRQHFSGRKTKMAHVNGMIGINVTEEERSKQIARLNWVVKRKIKNRKTSQAMITIAGCYDIENPIMISK